MLKINNLKLSIQSEVEKLQQHNSIKYLFMGITIATLSVTFLILSIGYYIKSKFQLNIDIPQSFHSIMNVIFRLVYISIFYSFVCLSTTKEYINKIVPNLILSGDSEQKLLISKFTVYNVLISSILLLQSLFVIITYFILPGSEYSFAIIKPFLINFLYLILVLSIGLVFSTISKTTEIGIIIGILYVVAIELIFINIFGFFNEKLLNQEWLTKVLNLSPFSVISKISSSEDGLDITLNLITILIYYILIMGMGLYSTKNRQIFSR